MKFVWGNGIPIIPPFPQNLWYMPVYNSCIQIFHMEGNSNYSIRDYNNNKKKEEEEEDILCI